MIAVTRKPEFSQAQIDTTFEVHYAIGDLARQWRLGRETVRLLVKDEPGVLKIRMGQKKSLTRYSVPESVARAYTPSCSIPLPDGVVSFGTCQPKKAYSLLVDRIERQV